MGGFRRIGPASPARLHLGQDSRSMHRFAAFHRVTFALRVFTAAATLMTVVSLPSLWRKAPWPVGSPVAALGLFPVSIMLFRPQSEGQPQ